VARSENKPTPNTQGLGLVLRQMDMQNRTSSGTNALVDSLAPIMHGVRADIVVPPLVGAKRPSLHFQIPGMRPDHSSRTSDGLEA